MYLFYNYPMCTVIFHTLNSSLAILLFFQVDRMSGSLNDNDHSSISLDLFVLSENLPLNVSHMVKELLLVVFWARVFCNIVFKFLISKDIFCLAKNVG